MKLKYAVFSILFAVIVIIISVGLVIPIDMFYHKKFMQHHGLNYKGYRGMVVGKKKDNEVRIVVVGGSCAFGYGVHYNEALPFKLEEELREYRDSKGINKKVTVINLAYNVEGAYAFYLNLKDFLYLDYDYVIFYSGYNDLGIGNVVVYRHSNPIFRMFKYMPILPLIMQEKKMVLESGGRLNDAYLGKKIVFTPNRTEQIEINILDRSLKVYNQFENFANRVNKFVGSEFDMEKEKNDKWAWYKHYMEKAIDFALAQKKKVIVIAQPYISDSHILQQESLRSMLNDKYKNNPNLLYVDLSNALPLKNEELAFDGMHFTDKGCKKMARIIREKISGYIFEE